MLEEYDFSKGIRGKYAKRYAEGTNVVVIEPDVAKLFPDHDSVNQALRSLAEIIKRQKNLHNTNLTRISRVRFLAKVVARGGYANRCVTKWKFITK